MNEASAPARVINIVLGIWLFISAFVWPHTLAQRTNTWILGVLAFIFAIAALRLDVARYLNTALAIWLFISVFVLARETVATAWNNCIVAALIFFFSLTPTRGLLAPAPSGDRRIPPPQQPRTV